MCHFIKVSVISLFLGGMIVPTLRADNAMDDRPYKKELIEFIALLNEYVAVAGPGNTAITRDAVAAMKPLSRKIATFYFDKVTKDKSLGDTLIEAFVSMVAENPHLNEEFVFLGNAFVELALEILSTKNRRGPTNTYKATKIGAVTGIVVGTLIIIVMKGSVGGLITGGLVAAGAIGIGFLIGQSSTTILRVDPRVQTAEDFNARFKSGRDLVNYRLPLALLQRLPSTNGVEFTHGVEFAQ